MIQSHVRRRPRGGGPKSDIFHSSSTGSRAGCSHSFDGRAKLGVTAGGIVDCGVSLSFDSGSGSTLAGSAAAGIASVSSSFGGATGVSRDPQFAQNRSVSLFSWPQFAQVFNSESLSSCSSSDTCSRLLTQSGIEGVSKAVAQQIYAERADENHETGEERKCPRLCEVGPGIVEHISP